MNENFKLCPNCGNQLKEYDMFCSKCGMTVNNQNTMANNSFVNPSNDVSNTQSVIENTNPPSQVNMSNSFVPSQENIPNNGYVPIQNNVSPDANNNYTQLQNNIQSNINNTPKNEKKSFKYIIIGLVVLILTGVGVFLLLGLNNGNGDSDNITNNNTNNGNSNSNTGNNTESVKTVNVSYEGYTFAIPSNYTYKIDDGTLTFGAKSGIWSSGIKPMDGDYNLIINNKSQIISSIESSGYKVNNSYEKTYSGLECLVLETEYLGQKIIISYVKVSSTKMFVVSTLKSYQDYDYNLFAETIEIIKAAL